MSKKKTTEQDMMIIEKKHSDIRFIDSAARGLYYAVAPGDDRIAILCGGGKAILTLEQLYVLSKEAFRVWEENVDASCKKQSYSRKERTGATA